MMSVTEEATAPVRQAASSRVLVLDDDHLYREALVQALTTEGYSTLPVDSGREALRLIKATKPALMLVDLMMPAMSGFEFLQHVRRDPALRSVPVVIVTAANDSMLAVRLDVPVVYKGDLGTILDLVRRRMSPRASS